MSCIGGEGTGNRFVWKCYFLGWRCKVQKNHGFFLLTTLQIWPFDQEHEVKSGKRQWAYGYEQYPVPHDKTLIPATSGLCLGGDLFILIDPK